MSTPISLESAPVTKPRPLPGQRPEETGPASSAKAVTAPKSKAAQPAPQKKDTAAALEQEVRQLDKDMDKAEAKAKKTGLQFGKKLIQLRELRKKTKQGDWMAYLQQVVKIKYEKARYWINVVEGKSNHRRYHEFGAAPNSAKQYRSPFQKPLKDWPEAQKRMNDFLIPLKRLHQQSTMGADMLVPALHDLAALLGYKVEKV